MNQIRLEELYGPVGSKAVEEEKRALMPKKAAIGFVYEEPTGVDSSQGPPGTGWPAGVPPPLDEEDDSAEDSDSDIDLGSLRCFCLDHVSLSPLGPRERSEGDDTTII